MRCLTMALAAVGLLSGCGGNGTQVGFAAINSQDQSAGSLQQSTLAVSDGGGIAITLETAVAYLRDIELDLPDGRSCDGVVDELEGAVCEPSSRDSSDKIRIPGPFVIDLLAGTSTPDLSAVRIATGKYKRIDYRIEDGEVGEGVVQAGGPLDDRSFVVTGTLAYRGSPTQFSISLRFNEDARIEQPGGVLVEAEGDKLLVALDASTWLAKLNLAGCLDAGDLQLTGGALVIDDDTSSGSGDCANIETVVKNSIKTSAQLDRVKD